MFSATVIVATQALRIGSSGKQRTRVAADLLAARQVLAPVHP